MAANEPMPPITPTSRPPVGIVARMAMEREGKKKTAVARMVQARESGRVGNSSGSVNSPPPPPPPPPKSGGSISPSPSAASVGRDAATITRVKLAKGKARWERSMKSANGSSTPRAADSMDTSVGSGMRDKYAEDRSHNSNKSGLVKAAHSRLSMAHTDATNSTPRARGNNVPTSGESTWADASSVNTPANGSYYSQQGIEIGLQSLLSAGDTFDSMEQEIMDTELYKKFEEAFALTLKNNPGMLPGAPTVIDSVKQALLKVQRIKASQEKEMRQQLEKVKNEKEHMEAELRKEMGTMAMRKNELKQELEKAKFDKNTQQDSLTKQLEAVHAIKHEMRLKMDGVTKEKEDLSKHLALLAKSRSELEQALETEMKLVEKDRDALQKVVAERKRLQRQKEENKELERKIEAMTEAAGKEKRALQAEVADLKKFEEHVAQIRKENEEAREELERTKHELKSMSATMQTKKHTLAESKAEMEVEFKKEIEELEGQIQNTKMVHEKDMEEVVKSRVWSYLRRPGELAGENQPMAKQVATNSREGAQTDVESIIQSRVEAELQSHSKRRDDIHEELEATKEAKGRGEGDSMKREIERLREELEIVQARNPRNSRVLRDEIREEIDHLREEVRMPSSPYGLRESSPYSLASPRKRSSFAPRYTPRSPAAGRLGRGYGDERGSYFDEEEYATPPLSRRSPRARRSLDSRYYL